MMDERKVRTGDTERRFFGGKIERADSDATGITGLGIPTAAVTDLGPFTEEIAREAVTDAIEKKWDVRGLYNHDPNMLLGRTGSGTMELRADSDGLWYDIPTLPASRADVMEAVQRGDLDGNSFSFTVASEEWDESEERDKPHRTITRFGKLFDVGPVTFPAYDGHTVVSARSLEIATTRTEADAVTESVSLGVNEPAPEPEVSEPEPLPDNVTPRIDIMRHINLSLAEDEKG